MGANSLNSLDIIRGDPKARKDKVGGKEEEFIKSVPRPCLERDTDIKCVTGGNSK